MTYDDKLRQEALESAIESRENHWTHVRTLRHEDGSVTVIQVEEYIETWMSPRECDGNLSRLVMQHRDYCDLDAGDAGIEEARDRWGDESPLVERYVRMFRPDIAYYEPRWSVSGCSQSGWAYGYGYVLTEDLEGVVTTPVTREWVRQAFEEELAVYGAYFAGEVYYAVNITVGKPIVVLGDQGAYVAGYDVDEDSCGGFLGYDNPESIAEQFTDSPAV